LEQCRFEETRCIISTMAPKKEKPAAAAAKEEEKPAGVQAPDKKEFDEKSSVITAEVERLQKELKKLSSEIGGRTTGKEEFYAEKSKILEAVRIEGDAIKQLRDKKDAIWNQMQNSKQAAKQSKGELSQLKRGLSYSTTGEIDERIAKIEFELWTESVSLKEEKAKLEEIKRLKKDKPNVMKVHMKEAELTAQQEQVTSSSGNLSAELDALKKEIETHKAKKDEWNAQLTALVEDRKAQTGGMSELFESREALNGQIREQIKARDALRDEFKQKEREYYEYTRKQREERRQKAEAEREQWQKQRELDNRRKKVEALNEQPHTQEITLLEQTIKFCKSFQPKEEEATTEKKEIKHDNPDTHMVLLKKDEREEEFYYAPTKGKKKGKKGKKGDDAGAKPIKHNAETFKLFNSLKLEAPITTAEIPATLEKLESEMEKFRHKIKLWEEQRAEKQAKIMAGVDDEDDEDASPAPAAKEEDEVDAAAADEGGNNED